MASPADRRSIRLPGYDYRSQGAYFVTICTAGKQCILADDRLRTALRTAWRSTITHGREPSPHEFVVMPNHVHGIVWISGDSSITPSAESFRAQRWPLATVDSGVTGSAIESLDEGEGTAPLPGSLGALVRQFKSIGTQRIRRLTGRSGPVWQRGYHEHVIRNEHELETRRRYILDNPRRWATDPLHPKHLA